MVSSGGKIVIDSLEKMKGDDVRDSGIGVWGELVGRLGIKPKETAYPDLMLKTWTKYSLLKEGGGKYGVGGGGMGRTRAVWRGPLSLRTFPARRR